MVIKESKIKLGIKDRCAVLGVNRSSYYKWLNSSPKQECRISEMVYDIYHKHKGTYGRHRITQSLKNNGITVNHKKVYRIMCELGLKAVIRKKYCRRKYIKVNVVPNILNREFESDKPHKKLVCDVTELKRIDEKRYFLYSILDLYNNEILTAHISFHNDYGLVKQGLEGLALQSENAILHSDQGSQFTSKLYMEWAAQNNITLSMSRVGNCYDNAAKESFFGHFKEEFYVYHDPQTQEELLENISSFISYYNNDRIQMRFKMSPKQYVKSQNFSH